MVGIVSWHELEGGIELLTLYVLSEFQFREIGKSLFRQVEKDTLEKGKNLFTWVLEKNEAIFLRKDGIKTNKK